MSQVVKKGDLYIIVIFYLFGCLVENLEGKGIGLFAIHRPIIDNTWR